VEVDQWIELDKIVSDGFGKIDNSGSRAGMIVEFDGNLYVGYRE